MTGPAKEFIAVRAVIEDEAGRVLVIRESAAYLDGACVGRYDLPGGKVQAGETLVDAVKREVREECGLEVEVGEPFFSSEWHPVVRGETLNIFGTFFRCRSTGGQLLVGTDHDEARWLSLGETENVDLIEENVAALRELKARRQGR